MFCRISSLLSGSFAKETCDFKEPTDRSHPIVLLSCESILLRKVLLSRESVFQSIVMLSSDSIFW